MLCLNNSLLATCTHLPSIESNRNLLSATEPLVRSYTSDIVVVTQLYYSTESTPGYYSNDIHVQPL